MYHVNAAGRGSLRHKDTYRKRQNKSQGQMMHRGILDREEGLLKQVFVWKTEFKELKFAEVKD